MFPKVAGSPSSTHDVYAYASAYTFRKLMPSDHNRTKRYGWPGAYIMYVIPVVPAVLCTVAHACACSCMNAASSASQVLEHFGSVALHRQDAKR
jgi:hypothetical protein